MYEEKNKDEGEEKKVEQLQNPDNPSSQECT